MRQIFAEELYKQMAINPNIYLLTGDVGYGLLDKIRDDFPDRFVNCGASEQAMVGIAIGLALSGKIPFVYTISPFLLYRPFETIRNYINHEKIPVKLVGSGRDKDYSHDGISHWAEEDKQVMSIFNNVISLWPDSKESIPDMVQNMIQNDKPYYLNLKR